jgi:hypothetical protein
MELNPCFVVSPSTRPPTFVDSLLKTGFERTLEEDAMVYEEKSMNFKVNPDIKVAVNDESLIDVWTDISMKGFGVPIVLREALIDMYGKANYYKGPNPILDIFTVSLQESVDLCQSTM